MKLTDLAIDGIGVCNNVNFSQLSSGLNLIYGENGSGKSTIRQYIRGVLFGYQGPFWTNFLNQPNSGQFAGRGGQLNAVSQDGSFLLTRSLQPNATLQAQNLTNNLPSASVNLLGNLTGDVFDAFYNVDLQNRTDQVHRTASQLNSRLGVPTGTSRWATEAEYQSWKSQADARVARLESVRRELANANAERARLIREVENIRTNYTTRVQALDVEIDKATRATSMRSATIKSLRDNIETLNRQINDLQSRIDNSSTNVTYVPNPQPQLDRLSPLYERLDEIDNQISRWRRVQTDIQNQRVRLRDEMVVWNDLSLESEEHPYFRSREILVSLESRLDDVENQARHWENVGNVPTDPAQHARNIVSACSQMRDELYGLCQELGSQYKHIRHKAAVAELKQLRRCFNEMGENVKRLVNRRENTIAEIRQLDPAGADAIMRAENQFCECARHEGFLEARRRFIGSVQIAAAPQVDYTVVHPNLAAEREQLNQLLRQRDELAVQLPAMETELREREAHQARLIAEREQLRIGSESELQSTVGQLDNSIQQWNSELQSLQAAIEQDRSLDSVAPHALITLASRYLQQMSEGDLNKVWLTSDETRIQVTDRRGANIPVSSLGPGDQHLVTLSLCLAGASGVRAQVPLLLDDVFANIDSSRAIATANLLHELGSQGQQILAFTCHRAVMDRVAGSRSGVYTTFELPQTSVAPAPVVYPDRTPYSPPAPPQDLLAANQLPPIFTQPPALNTYPYIKYPVAGNPVGNMAEFPRHDIRETQIETEMQSRSAYSAPSIPMVSQPVVRQTTKPSSQPLGEDSQLSDFGFQQTGALQALTALNVFKAAQLLVLDPDQLPVEFEQRAVTADQVDRWQAEIWMMICVPGMTRADAQVLVASGIQEPEQLDTTPYEQLVGRITRYLNSNDGRRYSNGYAFDQTRVNRWYDSLRSTRNNWRRDNGYSRRYRRRSQRSHRDFDNHDERSFDNSERRNYTEQQPRVSVANSFAGRDSDSTTRTSKSKKSAKKNSSGPKMKFYLDMTDHVEAAPSIGPRTAERFEKVGVVTIADFLRQTAESMASKINYKRITAEVVRQWQRQTRLVCRIPNLRGHDAQLLVACGITEPEELATMNPEKVYGIVGPFSETKEGLKIIRSGKKPDLAEVKDWIDWASNHRNLKAA